MGRLDDKLVKIETTVRDYVDLIDSLNEKQELAEEQLEKTKKQIFTRIQLIQKQFKDSVQEGFAKDITASLDTYEETIQKVEYEYEALKKDFIDLKDKTAIDVKQGLEI